MRTVLRVLLAAALLAPSAARAAGPCDGLTAAQRQLVEKLQRTIHPYDCCDETLDRCLAAKRVCRLAVRLRTELCRRAAAGQDEAKVKEAVEKRARSMTPLGKRAAFDLSLAPPAGAGKVSVVVYACARCPLCKRVVPTLHALATAELKGRVQVQLRPYPIRSHPGAAEGGLALVAAARLKRFWPYALKLFAEFDSFSVEKLTAWATSVGLDLTAFRRELADAKNRELLVEAKKEGMRNGVSSTPALFINGRRFQGSPDHDTLRDVLEEESDRLAGKLYEERR